MKYLKSDSCNLYSCGVHTRAPVAMQPLSLGKFNLIDFHDFFILFYTCSHASSY